MPGYDERIARGEYDRCAWFTVVSNLGTGHFLKSTPIGYSLKSLQNRKFVCAELNNAGTLEATRDSAGGWEMFAITPEEYGTHENR